MHGSGLGSNVFTSLGTYLEPSALLLEYLEVFASISLRHVTML